MPRLVLRSAFLVAVVAVSVGCGDDPAIVPTSTPTAAVSVTPTVTVSPTPTPQVTSTLPAGVDQLLTFTFGKGVVTGPKGRVNVKLGSTLRIVVTSDVADEVHVHAYDKLLEVAAGATAQITFKASIPGVVKVELEKRAITLVTLQVQ